MSVVMPVAGSIARDVKFTPFGGGSGGDPLTLQDWVAHAAPAESTSEVFTAPSGISEGDLLVIVAATSNSQSLNAIAGWEDYGSDDPQGYMAHGDSVHMRAYWKIADGTEGNISVTSSGGTYISGWYYRFTGASGVKPFVANTNNFFGTALKVPGTYSRYDGGIDLYATVREGENSAPLSNTAASATAGWSQLDSHESGSGTTGASMAMGTREREFAGGGALLEENAQVSDWYAGMQLNIEPSAGPIALPTGPYLEGWAGMQQLSGATFTATMPDGIVADELLLAIATTSSPLDGEDMSTATTGWTKYIEIGDSGPDTHTAIFWKKALGADSPIVISSVRASEVETCTVLRISGADTTSPFDTYSSFSSSQARLGHTPPGLTVASNNSMGICIKAIYDGREQMPISLNRDYYWMVDYNALHVVQAVGFGIAEDLQAGALDSITMTHNPTSVRGLAINLIVKPA